MLNRIFGVLFLSLVAFLVISSIRVSNSGPLLVTDPQLFSVLKTIAIAIAILFLPLAWAYPQKLIKKIPVEIPLVEKLIRYYNAMVLRFALIETAGFSVAVIFLFTGDTDLMLILAIILLFFIISRPSPFKTSSDLNLNEEDKKQIMN